MLIAVSGGTYENWDAPDAENGRASGAINKALAQVLIDVGFDDFAVDYKVDGFKKTQFTGAVNAMLNAVNIA